MKFSHSKVECFNNCPYQYKLRYIDKLKTLPKDDPTDALIIGQALHKGVEEGVDKAVEMYYNSYPIINDKHIEEAIKLEYLIPKVVKLLPIDREHEIELKSRDFIGYIDLVIHNKDGTVDLLDIKYSNNVDKYIDSKQVHLYKYYYEKQYGKKVNKIGYIFVPKTSIRQKKTESIYDFRKRLKETLSDMEITTEYVDFDKLKVDQFDVECNILKNCKEFPKNETRLCGWCSYMNFCKSNGENTLDIL